MNVDLTLAAPSPPMRGLRSAAAPPKSQTAEPRADTELITLSRDQSGESASLSSAGPSRESAAKAVGDVNERLAKLSSAGVQFRMNEETGEMVIMVVDRESQEVIRTIPPEEFQRLSGSLENLRGLIINSQG